uniref:Uncharacterized protein n=1 Tax=Oryza glumipatula TaxID=40148 RepID=A0A0D9ZG91_9ORYZ
MTQHPLPPLGADSVVKCAGSPSSPIGVIYNFEIPVTPTPSSPYFTHRRKPGSAEKLIETYRSSLIHRWFATVYITPLLGASFVINFIAEPVPDCQSSSSVSLTGSGRELREIRIACTKFTEITAVRF